VKFLLISTILSITYVASNKDGDKKYWIAKKGVSVTYVFTQINGNIVYRSSEHSHAPDTAGTVAARRATTVHATSTTESSTSNIIRNAATWTSCRAKKTYRMTDERVSNIFREFLCTIAHNLRF